MTVFRAQVFYSLGVRGKWTNVYHISATSLIDARDGIVATGVPLLLSALATSAQIDKVLVSDLATDDFTDNAINDAGTFADSGSLLPLYNSVKVLFQPSNLGRPDLKYIKGVVGENTQSSGTLEPAFITTIDGIFSDLVSDMLSNDTPLCSEDGSLWGNVSVQPEVQMRQMHRKRKKKETP